MRRTYIPSRVFRKNERSFGKYFAPLWNIKIEDHISQVSSKIRPLVKGTDMNILRGWFIMKQHISDTESKISYNKTVLDDEKVVWIG
jgi:hypothetical protein